MLWKLTYTLTVFLITKVQRDQCYQHHNGCNTKQIFLRYIDEMTVNIINRHRLRCVLDDEVTYQSAYEHGDESKEDYFHSLQGASVFLREQHFDPDRCCLADQNEAYTYQEYEEEQMQIVKTEQVGAVDAFWSGYKFADAE